MLGFKVFNKRADEILAETCPIPRDYAKEADEFEREINQVAEWLRARIRYLEQSQREAAHLIQKSLDRGGPQEGLKHMNEWTDPAEDWLKRFKEEA